MVALPPRRYMIHVTVVQDFHRSPSKHKCFSTLRARLRRAPFRCGVRRLSGVSKRLALDTVREGSRQEQGVLAMAPGWSKLSEEEFSPQLFFMQSDGR